MSHWTTPRRPDVDPWAVTRFPEQEPDELDAMQRQAADERMQHAAYMARQAMAPLEDREDEFRFARGLMLAVSASAVLGAVLVVVAYARGWL